MKKILLGFMILGLFLTAGCEKVETGKYKEGTYTASVVDNYGGSNNTVIAVVYVNESGMIKSVYLDTTYTKNDTVSTKKALGNAYGMKGTSAKMGKITGGAEWYEQVSNLEKKIIEEQGLDWLTVKDDGTTDSVSSVTIKINTLYEAVNNAINQAKK